MTSPARHARHARHARPQEPRVPRAVVRAGLAVSAVGVAVVAGAAHAGSAAAAERPQAAGLAAPDGARQATVFAPRQSAPHPTGSGRTVFTPVKDLQLNPLANTPVDPLDNEVVPQIADFKPISSAVVTGPLAAGDSLRTLPVAGQAARLLPG